MELQLHGSTAFVTGGSRGIGFACARALAHEGVRVAIAGRDPHALAAAVERLAREGLTAHAECVDLRDWHALERTVARIEEALGGIEVLVNCAGAAKHHAAASVDHDRWQAAMQDKYLPYVHAMDAVVPKMAERGRGAVINIVGMGGKVASPTHMAGGAANAAIMLVSAGFAKSWGNRGVRVNVINPGGTMTERLAAQLEVKAKSTGRSVSQVQAEALAQIPLGRYGTPDEVASMAVFLASAQAAYVNGASIAMDGGASALP